MKNRLPIPFDKIVIGTALFLIALIAITTL